jgi:hypothetical protein
MVVFINSEQSVTYVNKCNLLRTYNVTGCLVEVYGGPGGDHGCVFIRGSKERL